LLRSNHRDRSIASEFFTDDELGWAYLEGLVVSLQLGLKMRQNRQNNSQIKQQNLQPVMLMAGAARRRQCQSPTRNRDTMNDRRNCGSTCCGNYSAVNIRASRVMGLRITSERCERVTAEFCGWRSEYERAL